MLTECPNCQTVFRVTGAILKMGHGQVRCGKCRTQFDALESLIDEEEFNKSQQAQNNQDESEQEEAEDEAAIQARPPDREEEITLEGSRIEISGTYRSLQATTDEPAQVMHEHVVIDREPQFEEDDDEPSEIDVSDDELAEAADRQLASNEEAAIQAHDGSGPEAENFRADYAADQIAPLSQRIWKRAQAKNRAESAAHTEHREIAAELAMLSMPEQKPERNGVWLAVSIAMVVALAAQLVHHHRDPLVRSPRWGDSISRAYRMLGLSLSPNWDLKAYELQVWDVTLGSERDTLRVRASVTNTAAFAQPYPMIKLALEDRWGGAVGMRAFKPEEYLPAAADRMMAPRQRANAELLLVDPGADAVGFQSHPCLPLDTTRSASQIDTEIEMVCSDDSPFVR
jgi:predicted Zn finger-like uncharacterized protein